MKYIPFLFFSLLTVPCYAQNLLDTSGKKDNDFPSASQRQWREFTTDRLDATESPYTVDACHSPFETAICKVERSNADGIKTIKDSTNFIIINLGLTH